LFRAGFVLRIQTTVRSRNYDSFDKIAETALEESAIVSKNEKHRGNYTNSEGLKCSNCNEWSCRK
jgi:hypothetical protein